MACATKLFLVISCKGLADEDVLSKSDPFAVIQDSANRELGRTETVKDNLNPSFQKQIAVDYLFETKQTMNVTVYDFDKGGNHDLLGRATFTLGQLMSSRGSCVTLNLSIKGTVTITGLAAGSTKGNVSLQFFGRQLKNMDTFSKSDPFYILSRILPNGNRQQLYKSETIDNNLDPRWKAQPVVDVTVLCSGDLNAKVLVFQCFDEDLTENEAMGEFVCSVNELITPRAEFRLEDPKNKSNFFGYIGLTTATFVPRPDFLDLLKHGLQLNIAFSIDFTGSNLEARNPKSLHYYHPTQPNQYIQAMLAVSDVVQEYDSDKSFPAFGFGAIIPGSHEANHFFHLNLGPNPYLTGMQQIIDTYVQTLQQIRFYGPTNFAPTITNVTKGARQATGVYTILLIMTDGEITDMDQTIAALVEADDAPLSVLIVGVGNADFGSMVALDSDNGSLRSFSGRTSRRDIVQFVPMRDFIGRGVELAAALLAEIPDQVSRWAELCPQQVAQFKVNPVVPTAPTGSA